VPALARSRRWISPGVPSRSWWTREGRAQAVIIATGASHKHLGVPGEDLLETKGDLLRDLRRRAAGFRNQPLVVVAAAIPRAKKRCI